MGKSTKTSKIQLLLKWLPNFALFFVLIWFAIAGLWNLQAGSLQPWDEAWYGSISRNMLQTGNIFHLRYNQQTFFDHPPLGFQLKALSMALLGDNSFAVRFPEVLAGMLSVALVYLIGRKLSSDWAGFWAAVILLSSRWFLFRARSGNLDVLLLTTQLLVIMSAVYLMFPKSEKSAPLDFPSSKNFWQFLRSHLWLWLMWLFLSLSLMAKTLISLQLLPMVGVIFLMYWRRTKYNLFSRESLLLVSGSVICLIVPLLPWLIAYMRFEAHPFIEKLFVIGFRSGTEKSLNMTFIVTMANFFNAAVHKWFKPMLMSFLLAFVLLVFKKTRFRASLLISYVAFVAGPYLISEKTEIWHLIPLIGAMALLSGVVIDLSLTTFFKLRIWNKISYKSELLLSTRMITSIAILAIAAISYKDYWSGFISVASTPTDYEKIAKHISYPDQALYSTTDAYLPGLVYYANLKNAYVAYISDNEFVRICNASASKGQTFQAVSRFGDWMTNQGGERFISAREGGLVLIEIKPEECRQIRDSKAN